MYSGRRPEKEPDRKHEQDKSKESAPMSSNKLDKVPEKNSELDTEAGSTEGMGNVLDSVPSVRNGEFNKWFNSLTPDEFDKVWADPKLRESIKDRLRHPGRMHEWNLVSHADTFKRWGGELPSKLPI